MITSRSRIFEHVHTVASFCGDVGAEVKYDSNLNTIHVITAVGNQYNVYSLSNLAKLYASDLLPAKITRLAVQDYTIACVCDETVHICVRGKIVASYKGHSAPILGIFFMGDFILTWDTDSEVHIFHKTTCECYSTLSLEQPTFSVAAILHPFTYLNKILVGSHSGQLQLWNVKTIKRIHEFKKWTFGSSGVTCLSQSPVVDVVAVGYSCGTILICNIRTETSILKYNQNNSRINHLSFRLDDAPVLVASSEDGFVGCWNLNEKTLESLTRLVDDSDHSLTSMQCIKSQSLMMTSCNSNSLRLWIFDSKAGCAPRLLVERFGHAKGSITKVRFYGGSQTILTTGLDGSVKKLSLVHERHSRNLGRSRITQGKSSNSKAKTLNADLIYLGASCALSGEARRETDWDSAVTCHRDSDIVCTWSVFKSTIGSYRLKPQPGQGKQQISFTATCVHLTSCGNFCVVGYSDGSVNKFNIQSGQFRGSVESNLDANKQPAPCAGIAVDNLNTKLVVCRLNKVYFYHFDKLKLLGDIVVVSEDIEMMRLHCESSLLAVALIDFTVEVVDYVAQTRVRVFNDLGLSCHSAKILDMAFSADCKWLVTGSLDCTIRVWSLSTRSLIDCFSTENPPVSLDFSPTADVLVVAFLDSVGVAVLSNIALYRPVDLSPLPENFKPTPLGVSPAMEVASQKDEGGFSEELDLNFNKLLETTKSLSLTREGVSKWQNLLKYDVIKQKNKPREPPKAPKLAPFFIPTIPGLDFQLNTDEAKKLLARENKDSAAKSKVLHEDFSVLAKRLSEKEDFEAVLKFLEEKSVASIDFEIYSLGHAQEDISVQLISQMLSVVRSAVSKQTHLDTAHVILQMLLKHHGAVVMNNLSTLEPILAEIRDSHSESWSELSQTMQMCSAVASFLRSPLV